MKIEIFGTPERIFGIYQLFQSWQQLQDPMFEVSFIESDQKLVEHVRSFTGDHHEFVSRWRTIIRVNNKHIFFDCSERRVLAAESHACPFDLIIKCQYAPGKYSTSIAPVSPFVYILNSYDMAIVEKYRKVRDQCVADRKFASSMFWAGSIRTRPQQRGPVKTALQKLKLADTEKKSFEDYYNALACTQVGVVVAGRGDFTHRELELESIGTPYFRKTYEYQTYNPRVPNYHYYTIDLGIDYTLAHFTNYFEPNGEYKVFTPEEWDQYCAISANSLKWFNENGSPQGSFNIFKEILERYSII